MLNAVQCIKKEKKKMKRISELETRYVLEALGNEFNTSVNSYFNNKFESEFASKYHSRFAIGHINGTATLHTALNALGIKEGDEVIVPPLTMSSTSIAVLQNGSLPVFADVKKDTFVIDPESILKVITARTKAVMSVALYGLSPDYDKIIEICKKYNLWLIEDNAQSFYSLYKGKYVGEFGDFSSFSFQASKHLSAGEGGILITNNEEYANNARRFNSLGYAGVSAKQGKITRDDIQNPNYSRHVSLGFNYRMSEIQAAVLLGQLERAYELVDQRVKVAHLFDEALVGSDLLIRQVEPEDYKNTYWSYSVVLNTNNPDSDWQKFRSIFKANGGDGYYAAWKLSYNEPLFRDQIQNKPGIWQRYNPELCPVAEYLQKRMIQFKTNYWDIKEAEQQAEILYKTVRMF
jgi:perosamine synthetase